MKKDLTLQNQTEQRPWGHYKVIETGEEYLIKCIVVNPKQKLSLQYHDYREEHWVVLEGEATVVKGESKLQLKVGQSIDIAIKEVHSLQNSSEKMLKILEIQKGKILDENDITRIQDDYGRA